MAGNLNEWTMEVYNNTRVRRGGNIWGPGDHTPSSFRSGADLPESIVNNNGFRITLYLCPAFKMQNEK